MFTYYIENGITRPDGKKLIARGCAEKFTKSLEQKMKGKVYRCNKNLCNSALNVLANFGLIAMSIAITITINAL